MPELRVDFNADQADAGLMMDAADEGGEGPMMDAADEGGLEIMDAADEAAAG